MRRIAVLFMVLIIALAMVGVGHAWWTNSVRISGTIMSTGAVDDCFHNVSCTEWPEAEGKDVGSCWVSLVDLHNMLVSLNNAYPGYGCTIDFEIGNSETIPVVISYITITPDNFTNGVEISATVLQIYEGQQIDPGVFVPGQLEVQVEQPAEQNTQYTFTVTVELRQWAPGGTIGFWKNWDKHNTYEEAVINGWLGDNIEAASNWLVEDMDGNGVIDVADMEAIIDRATSSNKAAMNYKFLGHYLATRLDTEAGRLDPGDHDLSGHDPGDYLGLGGSGDIYEIIQAIEDKYGTSPTDDEYEIMKDICDALNNMEI